MYFSASHLCNLICVTVRHFGDVGRRHRRVRHRNDAKVRPHVQLHEPGERRPSRVRRLPHVRPQIRRHLSRELHSGDDS